MLRARSSPSAVGAGSSGAGLKAFDFCRENMLNRLQNESGAQSAHYTRIAEGGKRVGSPGLLMGLDFGFGFGFLALFKDVTVTERHHALAIYRADQLKLYVVAALFAAGKYILGP